MTEDFLERSILQKRYKMTDYLDYGFIGAIGSNLMVMVDSFKKKHIYKTSSAIAEKTMPHNRQHSKKFLSSEYYKVRPSICVAGLNRAAVMWVKDSIAKVMVEPLPLESFHVKTRADVKDGALLVPKIVLVASHCPGKKLIDDHGDEGQLDFLYDEVCDIGADLLLVYVGLPRVIYPHNKALIYHQKAAELLFPTQPILQSLALDHCFITVSENSDLNHIQKNVVREWIAKPIGPQHQVYKTAEYLSDCALTESGCWTENEIKPKTGDKRPVADIAHKIFVSATEEHPLIEKKRRKTTKLARKGYGAAWSRGKDEGSALMIPLTGADDELGVFNEAFSYHADNLRTDVF